MRDWTVVFALVCATFGAGVVFYYGWPERNTVPKFGLLLKVLAGMLVFLWVSIGALWING